MTEVWSKVNPEVFKTLTSQFRFWKKVISTPTLTSILRSAKTNRFLHPKVNPKVDYFQTNNFPVDVTVEVRLGAIPEVRKVCWELLFFKYFFESQRRISFSKKKKKIQNLDFENPPRVLHQTCQFSRTKPRTILPLLPRLLSNQPELVWPRLLRCNNPDTFWPSGILYIYHIFPVNYVLRGVFIGFFMFALMQTPTLSHISRLGETRRNLTLDPVIRVWADM